MRCLPSIRAFLLTFSVVWLTMLAVFSAGAPAYAVEAISVPLDGRTLDLRAAVEYYRDAGARLQVSTAPGPDGIIRRIEVQARDPNVASNWAVFALANNGNQQIDRLLVAPHYWLPGSGLFVPDLGRTRITNITPSEGFAPERVSSKDSDVFLITLDPGAVVTFIVEMQDARLPKLELWEANVYRDSVNNYTLYRGLVIGIAGLLAVFLTIIFVVKGTAMFPAAAGLAWGVLIYVCIDFGFWNEIFNLSSSQNQIHRAAAEIFLSASLVVFIYTYLNLDRWNTTYRFAVMGVLFVMALIVGIAMIEPSFGAGVARIVFGLTVVGGLGLIGWMSWLGYDRAVMIIPTWLLMLFWIIAATVAVTGYLDNDTVQPALAGGMVLIVLLIGFTLMQHAFTGGAVITGDLGDQQRRALALTGSGDMIWDWDVMRDRMVVSPEVEQKLGLRRGTLESHARDWLEFLHQSDRDRFRLMLDTVLVQRRGRVVQDFRLRSQNDDYHWFSLRARPVIGSDGEVVRCVGTLTDITEQKIAQERLMHDAVHDNLTGLPNRELFIDRLQTALTRSEVDDTGYPSVIVIDIDQFSDINDNFGLAIGDSVLLAVSRRLTRMTRPQDTIARINGDQFAMMLISEEDTAKVENIARAVLRTLKTAIPVGDDEIFLSGSIGIAHFEDEQIDAQDLLRQAETALYDAKRKGGNEISVFAEVTGEASSGRLELASRLRKALERDELLMYYQPIIRLEDRSIAGFEALMRWEHPELGTLAPSEFIPIAEESNLIADIGLFALEESTQQLAEWQQSPRIRSPLFMTVNVSSRQLFRQDLINDVKSVFLRSPVHPGSLKLEITESLVMENPEYAAQVLERLRDLGTGLALDDFGTGYSSLSYLQRFPFDTLKIDKSFVRQNGQESQLVILRSIIALAHDLDMDVVAEGAENESDVVELTDQECEYAQGFLFGQPMKAEEAEEMLFRNTSYATA